MGYRRISYKEKIKAVEAVNNGMRLSEVARILGIPKTTISNWLANDEFNPDKEYVRIRAERKGSKKHAQKNPFPEGVEMARNKDPQELERENRDLRKKTAYLEDKVAYLEALYEIIKEISDTISKKKMQGNLKGSRRRTHQCKTSVRDSGCVAEVDLFTAYEQKYNPCVYKERN